MSDNNNVPSFLAAGSFEALSPFNVVVDVNTFYTVEDIKSIPKMQAEKEDIYKLVFAPVGISTEDYQTVLERSIASKVAVIVLTSRGNPDVYVLSSYLKNFPQVDGIVYERLCLISCLGSVPPSLKEKVNTTIAHINDYIKSTMGVEATTSVGTIPTKGYVTKEQAELFEVARQNKITNIQSDIERIKELEDIKLKQEIYIKELEDALKTKI